MKAASPVRVLQLKPLFEPGVRIPSVDRLKGLGLLLVLLYHAGGVLGRENLLHGETGVDVFLIVSGFILALNSATMPAATFLRRRFFRIYPAYWLALAIFLPINAHLYADHKPAIDIALHIVGLHGFSTPAYFSDIEDALWFISLIVLVYLVFLGIRRHLHNLGLVVGVCGILTTILLIYYERTGNNGGVIEMAVRIPSVFLGFLFGQLASGRPVEIRATGLAAAGLMAATYGCLFPGVDFAYAVAALAWIAAFMVAERWLLRVHSGRTLLAAFSFLGIYSYEIYLFHQLPMRDYNAWILNNWFEIPRPSQAELCAGMAVALTAVILWSVLVHRATERLFRGLRPPLVR